MKKFFYLSAGAIGLGVVLASSLGFPVRVGANPVHAASSTPELEYMKAINSVAPPRDPQLIFLLMGRFSSAKMQTEGIDFFSARLKEFDPQLTDAQKSLYLSAIGLLRAQHAPSVPFLQRMGYVKETINTFDEAKRLSGGQIFVVNWITGVVYAELPGVFHERQNAETELKWCLENADKAPHAGWLREVYYRLGKLAKAGGDGTTAQSFLKQSGYSDFDSPIVLITPFSEEPEVGHSFTPRRITEIVPKRVYALSGFEFTEYYFVVSDDGKELICIDAGTRPDSAKSAYEALQRYAPGLPKLTTLFVTHAHWDHVGGHAYFQSLNPNLRIFANAAYQEEVDRELSGPGTVNTHFFGTRFNLEDVRSFKPDVLIDHRTDVTIGGTPIELIPVRGGETHDAMLIYLPGQNVMFVGDILMPYLGAPFIQEGDLQGLLDTIDVVAARNPSYLLHGHEPLTRNFTSAEQLMHLKQDLIWLRAQVLEAIKRGDERGTIHRANLIPPGFLKDRPDVFLPYFILREHVIDRLYDQTVGYWQADLQGVEHLTSDDQAQLLVDYLGVSEHQLVLAANRLVEDGKYELAASLLESSGTRFDHSDQVAKVRRLVYLKLMEENQNTDPFKYIIYSAKINQSTSPMITDAIANTKQATTVPQPMPQPR